MSKLNRYLALTTVGASLALVGSAWQMKRFVKKHRKSASLFAYAPKVSLMVPCKDLDPDFEENMQCLLEQGYPDYELIFMTVNEQDPCYPVLQKIVARSPVPAKIVLGGFSMQRCQKLDNILAGLQEVRPDSEVFVWVDTDARVPRSWLRDLVSPLKDPEIGVTSTFRWYRPEPGRHLTYLLTMWAAYQFSHMHLTKAKAVWGGSMAIRREFFEQLNMLDVWDTALADDCVLHDHVLKAGKRIEFVAPAMTSISSDLPTGEILHFAMRQCVIAKVTLTDIWWISILGLSFLHACVGKGLWGVAQSARGKKPWSWADLGLLSFIPASMLQALLTIQSINLLASTRAADDPMHGKAHWALYGPLGYLFLWGSLLSSSLRRHFHWRAIGYRMHHPLKTEIFDYPDHLVQVLKKELTH